MFILLLCSLTSPGYQMLQKSFVINLEFSSVQQIMLISPESNATSIEGGYIIYHSTSNMIEL